MQNTNFEILAPAGDEEMLRAAVFSGANCVYLGISGFNARKGAANFSGQGLARAVRFCHARNCKVYAALNTVVLPGEEESLRRAVLEVLQAGCDAVIVQDLATANMVKSLAPGMPLHASTQMSVHSLAGVQALANLGFSRAILARELTLAEIEAIAKNSPIELEVFVHGALCFCVSGQCYLSAFIGGRSANRGACAAPCRLPFRAGGGAAPAKSKPAGEEHHLSLKDLSILDALPRLREIGVCSAKIEGRLRGPEYCAVVVDAARKVLNKQEYDKELLQKVFSRSGFTDAWFTGKTGKEMFGTRAAEDAKTAKAALPKVREIYRREIPRVPVTFALQLGAGGGQLQVIDGVNTFAAPLPGPLQPAQAPADGPLRAALEKTGGTPFYAQDIQMDTGGFYAPVPAINGLRRQLLEELLQKREEAPLFAPLAATGIALPTQNFGAPPCPPKPAVQPKPVLRARFATVAQLPPAAPDICEEFVFPLFEADKVPEALRSKSWLWLPNTLFGRFEEFAKQAVGQAAQMGFMGFEMGNLSHFILCGGQPVSGGFGLNCTNAVSAAVLHAMGCCQTTLSPELTLRQMRQLAGETTLPQPGYNALCYGYLPLMVTRACPLHNTGGCANCTSQGYVTDRMGATFAVTCAQGVRTIHNSVPLWMADRLADFPTQSATLYFTTETQQQAGEVLRAFAAGFPAPGAFTRGLYERGIAK